MNVKCIRCKGSNPQLYCGKVSCPIIAKAEAMFKSKNITTKSCFDGKSPAPFVGRFGYPDVNVGIMAPGEIKEKVEMYDAPKQWAFEDYKINDIINLRSALINSRFKANIKKIDRFTEISQEVGIASKPVELEFNLKDKPKFKLNTDSYLAPSGPNAVLEKAKIISNPKIHTKVDKVVSDTDLLSKNAVLYLYKNDFDENFLSKILSVGTLGLKKNRRLVPTRWSITATDDMIGKDILTNIKDYPNADYTAFFGGYLGNYYLILFFPDIWSYELFEMYMPNASWNISSELQYTTDYESYKGRKTYAEETAGGYYACKLPVLEKLKSMKRQASVLVLRFITGEYIAPLGVWVCREATRKSMQSKGITFSDKELMLRYASVLIKKKFGFDINTLLNKSILLRELNTQRKLGEF